MVKHNNVIPFQHFHKKWSTTSRGPLKVIVPFNQAAQKKVRRMARAKKAAAMAPRPTAGPLRPAVRCPTQKYHKKVRLGRGFSLAELKAAKIPQKLAKTIGIAVDVRRTNKSVEALEANVARLKEYKEKLVIFPRKGTKAKSGDASKEALAAATQLTGPLMPLTAPEPSYELVDVPEAEEVGAYSQLRIAKNEQRMEGIRKRQKADKEKEKK